MTAAGMLISGIGELLKQLNVYESKNKLVNNTNNDQCCSEPACDNKK